MQVKKVKWREAKAAFLLGAETIPNKFWLNWLIDWLKNLKFIKTTVEINQKTKSERGRDMIVSYWVTISDNKMDQRTDLNLDDLGQVGLIIIGLQSDSDMGGQGKKLGGAF